MPSKSKAQQRFFGMVDAYKKGEMKNASSKIKKAAKGMSMDDVKDFAETKHNGLPEKVEEQTIIRLTESDLHQIVKESVNKILTELDWKTYANYAKGRRAQGNWSKADAGDDAAINAFNKKYAASDYENRNGLERSAGFSMSNGADGAKKYDLGYRSSVKNNGDYQQYINRHRESGLYEPFYKDQTYNQGEWYGQHGMDDDDVKNTNNMGWSPDVKTKMNQGIKDVDRYQKGQSKYIKGQGWQ